ncbi:MAG: error-prone DNA polymerase [Pseudomonadota bacterium]
MATLVEPTEAPQSPKKTSITGFAELHARSNYSFLASASHPEELVVRAAELGYSALAVTDECSLAGIVKAHVAAQEQGLKLIVGASFQLTASQIDGAPSPASTLVLLAPSRQAYGQLCALITRLRRRSPKGEYWLEENDLHYGLDQCLALWVPDCGEFDWVLAQGERLKQRFAALWVALELFHEADDLDLAARALTLSARLELPIVATNDVRMHHISRQPLYETLSAIRLKTTVAKLGQQVPQNAERRLRSLPELRALYPEEMLSESLTIADRCQFSLTELRYEYPEELVPPHLTPTAYLRQLTETGATERWPDGVPDTVRTLIEKELGLIASLGYEHFFLTVQDIVAFARSQGILCQGRGSAANSAVCYCLHITEVDPGRMSVLFERFISKERNEPPDIDVDFEHERREEVIQYLYKRYGRDRAALAATLITYRPRSAVRDVGKALGMDLDLVDLLAKSLSWWDNRAELGDRLAEAGLELTSPLVVQFLHLVHEVLGFPRHLSQHVGGFVIARHTLAQLVPVENASMADRTVIQWDKDDLEALGLLKVDVLGLGMLTAIRKGLALASQHRPEPLTLDAVPPEDPDTYAMLQRGDSIGVFQVESRAQMAMLPRLKPERFYDLVVEVAIVRPGPIQGNMVHPYLRRRQGLEPVEYPSPEVEKVLNRTLGVPIFQEQVIELAMVAAGFSAGEADQLRRAMAAWKRKGGLGPFEQKIIEGMRARGHDQAFAERVFRQIQGFGEYGFPESHAASFALLVYVSAWLKCHEPEAFYCGLLNSLPMGFYSASQLIQDAERHGVVVLPVDANLSQWDHQLVYDGSGKANRPALRLGLRRIKGLDEFAAQRIAAQQPYGSVDDLVHRARLDRQHAEFLARTGALRSLSGHRYQAHWDTAAIETPMALLEVAEAAPEASITPPRTDSDAVELPAPTTGSDVLADYRYLDLSLGPHPLALLRHRLPGRETTSAADLVHCRHGQFVRVAGLVTGRQRPGTATGVLFVTLEDETENINLVVWASVLEQFRAELLQGQLLLVRGVVEREERVIHVVAGVVEDHSTLLGQLGDLDENETTFRSRDFR